MQRMLLDGGQGHRGPGHPRPLITAVDEGVQDRRSAAVSVVSRYAEALREATAGISPPAVVFDRPVRGLVWRVVSWPGPDLPHQGWKIHVTAAATEAVDLVRAVVSTLVGARASFKLPATIEGIVRLNGGDVGATQLGKVVTVYPATVAQASELAATLDRVWPRSAGPAVPSDLRTRPGSAVSWRYGAFGGGPLLPDSYGRLSHALERPDGTLVPDVRSEDGQPPEWAPPPPGPHLPPSPADPRATVTAAGREYLPLAILQRTARTRVVLGVDLQSGDTAILKAASRGVGGDECGVEARDWLRNEARVLEALAGAGAPRLVALADGDPTVLVVEDLEGTLVADLPRAEQLEMLPLVASALADLHATGLVHRDVKLENAMKTEGGVRLIDYELATPVGAEPTIRGGSPGHLPPEGASALAAPAADVYGLGICLARALLGHNPAGIPHEAGRLVGLVRLFDRPEAAHLVAQLTHADPSRRPAASLAGRELSGLPRTVPDPSTADPRECARLADPRWLQSAGLSAGLRTRAYRRAAASGSLWRNFHFESDFDREGLNLGAAGIILGLLTLATALRRPDEFRVDVDGGADWLAGNRPGSGPPGLFTGDAGVAVALAVVGRRHLRPELTAAALERLEAAAAHVIQPDLFAGGAGVLWAACLMAEVLGDRRVVERVERLGEELLSSAETRDGVATWPTVSPPGEDEGPLTGAAHGTAGIAFALSCWGALTGRTHVVELASRGLAGLYEAGRTEDGRRLRRGVESASAAAPVGDWCHGIGGYLWCILARTVGDPLDAPVDWGVARILEEDALVPSPTYCHGLAGRLELWRLISTLPRYREVGARQVRSLVARLRLLHVRDVEVAWSSEDAGVVTPDLWVGFLGPATALALAHVAAPDALLSGAWLRRCAGEPAR